MSTDPHHDALMAIARSLTPDETAVILARLAPPGSRLHGAEVADLLDMLDQQDAYLELIEPFYADNELPQVTGTRYALYALIALDAELTVGNLTRMLTAAGLMPKVPALKWSPAYEGPTRLVSAWTATTAEGVTYLTACSVNGYAVLARYLTEYRGPGRYGREADALEVARMVALSTIRVQDLNEGRRLGNAHAAGQDVDEHPMWHRQAGPGVSTT